MKFTPEKYKIADEKGKPFIDANEIWDYINNTKPTKERVREVIAKSLAKNRLNLEETAVLMNADSPELIEEIKNGARELKTKVYGNRIVLFAPLYVGNKCANNCTYCGFAKDNKLPRKVLSLEEVLLEAEAIQKRGSIICYLFQENLQNMPEQITFVK